MWPFPSKEEREREKREEEARIARIDREREGLRTLEGIRSAASSRMPNELWVIIDTLAKEIEELKECRK